MMSMLFVLVGGIVVIAVIVVLVITLTGKK